MSFREDNNDVTDANDDVDERSVGIGIGELICWQSVPWISSP